MSAPLGLLKASLISVPVHTCIKNFSLRSRIITFPPTNLVLKKKCFGIPVFSLESLHFSVLSNLSKVKREERIRSAGRQVRSCSLRPTRTLLLFYAVGLKPGS